MDKIISLLIAVLYIIAEYIARKDGKLIFGTIIFLIFPLYLIWYGEGVGKWRFYMHVTTSETPNFMTKFAGWLLLLLPIVVVIIIEMSRRFR